MTPKWPFLLAALASVFSPISALWPLPKSIQTGSSAVRLATDFDIQVSVQNLPEDLLNAVARTKAYLKNDKLERLVVGRGSSDSSAITSAKTLTSLVVSLTSKSINVRSISEEAIDDLESRDETYMLTVPADGSAAMLEANSTLGLFRGLTTFGQLWYEYQGITYTLEAPVQIYDAPAYPYRGFLLDTARNYFPVSDIKRTLDAMSWVKINTFHWHIVDAQSFPLEVPGFPEISQKGAYSPTSVYSEKDVQDIVTYAAERGIDVLAEIDTPGHTSVISKSHPEHIACAEATPWATYANEPPAGQLRIASPATIRFSANLLSAAAKLFPSKYFSTGGDELNKNCYAGDNETQQILSSSRQTFEQALDTFTQTTHAALVNEGKTPVVWEEMVLANLTLAKNTIAIVWISSDDAVAVAKKGFRFIHAASDYFYLDCGAGAWVGNFPAGNSWCDPFKTWQRSYSFDPTANLTAAESKLVLGGQQSLWTEQSNPHNLDSIVWPRAASSAEVFWTGPGLNISTALPRLHDVAFRMQQRGIGAISLQPLWCALRPGVCDLTA